VRILVVEDDPDVASVVRRTFEGEGFSVDVATNGPDGLWQANNDQYDAVVLDLQLPGLSGYRVCEQMRAAGTWTPVLMLTAKDGEYDEADGLDLGADDYLTKPFSTVVLVSRVRALLRRGAPPRPTVLAVGDLRLDPASGDCWRGEREVQLTPRERALLETLMRHPEQVLSKAQLLDHVWGSSFDGDDNVVEVYLGYLRKKIDRPPDRPVLETVRGFGYRLRPDRS
jgi:DNA-binding response OmpR family regulator